MSMSNTDRRYVFIAQENDHDCRDVLAVADNLE
jgi:hypothetical protein